jgi:DNA replication protein DnaC
MNNTTTRLAPLPYKIENGVRQYNFKRSCQYLQFIGKQKFGANFRLHNSDKEILYKLLVYAIGDKKECTRLNLDLNKGILLNGPVGCGKTSLMTLLRHFHDPPTQYVIKSTREIATEFHEDGFTVINKYGKMHKIYCFDDLGVEQSMKYYGNECNTIGEILLHRYDLHAYEGIVTHATTNLNANELDELYGNRVRSRFRSMFNLIAFNKDVGDKRR